MGLDRIIKGIEDEAEKEASSIVRSARDKAGSIISDARVQTEGEISELQKVMQRELRDARNIHISDAKRKARQALLCAKEELIWDTLCGVRKRMSEMEGDELGRIYDRLVVTTLGSMGEEAEVYAVRELDAKMLANRNVSVNGVIERTPDPPEKLRPYTSRDLIGGFIAFSQNGRMVLDLSFQGLIDRDMERIRERISEVLFKD
jgi:vacuolar-type H+-ATPase subunit E/Vma4